MIEVLDVLYAATSSMGHVDDAFGCCRCNYADTALSFDGSTLKSWLLNLNANYHIRISFANFDSAWASEQPSQPRRKAR